MLHIKPVILGSALGAFILSATAAQPSATPLSGQWAGDRVQLVIDAQGGSLEGDCLSGRFAGPVVPSAEGRFSVTGPYTAHAPGPTKATAGPPDAPATYSGELHGGNLTLHVTRPGNPTAEVYNLQAGAKVKLIRCL